MNPRRGYVSQLPSGRWKARITYTDPDGRRHSISRTADTKSAARDELDELLPTANRRGRTPGKLRTLHDLLDYFLDTHVHDAQFRDGAKVTGYRDVRSIRANVETIRRLMSDRVLERLTYDHVLKFKRALLADGYARSKKDGAKKHPRSLANVHRILALLRHVLSIAERQGWIARHPFRCGPPLISTAAEKKRQRALTFDEEDALLAACGCDERRHIRAMIVCAIETGMRAGEILRLEWNQVSLSDGLIFIPREHCKTGIDRYVPISERLRRELLAVGERLGTTGSVFGRRSRLSRSWSTARRVAGLDDLRFHDLRHTFATRLVQAGVQTPQLARLLGHQDVSMSYRYTNTNRDVLRQNVERMNALRDHAEVRDVN